MMRGQREKKRNKRKVERLSIRAGDKEGDK